MGVHVIAVGSLGVS